MLILLIRIVRGARAGYVELVAHLSRHDWTIPPFSTSRNSAFCLAGFTVHNTFSNLINGEFLFGGRFYFVFSPLSCGLVDFIVVIHG